VFGPKQPTEKTKKRPAQGKETAVTILTSGCHFTGKLYTRGSSRIGGRIEGEIVSEGLLIIEEEAVIQAHVKAEEAIIQGRVIGTLESTGRVELSASSHFEGDIITPSLIVHEGAQFNGRATMKPATPANAEVRVDDKHARPKLVDGPNVQIAAKKGPILDTARAKVADQPRVPEINVPSTT
jgi:cytoskeletal protein CcmA (bactofilin family)